MNASDFRAKVRANALLRLCEEVVGSLPSDLQILQEGSFGGCRSQKSNFGRAAERGWQHRIENMQLGFELMATLCPHNIISTVTHLLSVGLNWNLGAGRTKARDKE